MEKVIAVYMRVGNKDQLGLTEQQQKEMMENMEQDSPEESDERSQND
jgi:hypothetical protein